MQQLFFELLGAFLLCPATFLFLPLSPNYMDTILGFLPFLSVPYPVLSVD